MQIGATRPVTCLSITSDGKRFVSKSNKGCVRVWNMDMAGEWDFENVSLELSLAASDI